MEEIQTQIPEITGSETQNFFLYFCSIKLSYLLLLAHMLFLMFLGRLEIEGKGKIWKQDQKIRLNHVDTRGYLHSHDKKYQRIAGGQQEVRFGLPILSFPFLIVVSCCRTAFMKLAVACKIKIDQYFMF